MKVLSKILILLIIAGCNTYDNDRWEIISGDNLGSETFVAITFKDLKEGYLGGRKSTYKKNSVNGKMESVHSSVVYKTTDQGQNWENLNMNIPGSISKIICSQNTIYVLNQFLENNSSILKTNDEGRSWIKLIEFNKDEYVRDFAVTKQGELMVLASNKDNLNLLKVGNSIDTIKQYSKYINKTHVTDKYVFTDQENAGSLSKGIDILNIETNEITKVNFDQNYWYSTSTIEKDQILIGIWDEKNNTSKLIRILDQEIDQIDIAEFSEYSINKIHSKDNLIVVDINHPDKVGPIGVTHELIVSIDNGINWKKIKYPEFLMVEPSYLLNNGNLISYIGKSRFQKLKTFANRVDAPNSD